MRHLPLLVVDLFSGTGSGSAAFLARGWRVVRCDLTAGPAVDVRCDVRHLPLRKGLRPTLLWASPPCNEFSTQLALVGVAGHRPDYSLIEATAQAVDELAPRYWVLENVAGAARYLGPPACAIGSRYLWGVFPWRGRRRVYGADAKPGRAPAVRAVIPFVIGWRLASEIERLAV